MSSLSIMTLGTRLAYLGRARVLVNEARSFRSSLTSYFSSSEEYYSEDEISIHCISEEELVREEDVRV